MFELQELERSVKSFGESYPELTFEDFEHTATNDLGSLIVCAVTDKDNLALGIAHFIKIYIEEREQGDEAEYNWFLENLRIEDEHLTPITKEIRVQLDQYNQNRNEFLEPIPRKFLGFFDETEFDRALRIRDYSQEDPEELDHLFLWVVLESKEAYFYFGCLHYG